jgi:magnesium transporter
LWASVLIASLCGGTLPFLLHRLGRDPAMMTGPLLTTIVDLISFFIFLGLGTLFLPYLENSF